MALFLHLRIWLNLSFSFSSILSPTATKILVYNSIVGSTHLFLEGNWKIISFIKSSFNVENWIQKSKNFSKHFASLRANILNCVIAFLFLFSTLHTWTKIFYIKNTLYISLSLGNVLQSTLLCKKSIVCKITLSFKDYN